ncbi:hypothetical protein NE237_033210 [Protea cynaroides]|uniref:Uncharacterized protein n=1 Tax=Protea cynaroides TaxID=273540 RepID=A0A9Q0L4G8_9MAGN|nr:hypothetical protein NE237_033210 [Protea cynaroides]
MEGKDTSESKGKSSLPQADVDQPQNNIETNGGVLIVKEEAALAISKTTKKKSKSVKVEEMLSSTMSPQSSYSFSSPASSFSVDGMSCYASAQTLLKLGCSTGCNYDDEIDRYASAQNL